MDNEGNDASEVSDQPQPETAKEIPAAEPAETLETAEKIIENIEKPIEVPKPEPAKPVPLKRALICIGEYPTKLLLKGAFLDKSDLLTIFINKSGEEINRWSKASLNADNLLGLDVNVDTHFWFNVSPIVAQNDAFIARLKSKPIDNQHGALVVSSSWDGVGSAGLPAVISQLKEQNTNSVALALLPSKLQPPDAQFNALSSMGTCASKDFATVLLVGRDQLNKYVGVNRNGSVITGDAILSYILELMLAKETFVQELSELSRSFNVRFYTILSATGASLEVYGTIENMLNSALFRPLLSFDLSTVSLLYVLLRIPLKFKDKLPRDKIELAIANWFKEKATLKSIYVTEPLYVDDVNDRIDVALFVGGFALSHMVTWMEKKANAIAAQAMKQGLIKEEEWKGAVTSLVKD